MKVKPTKEFYDLWQYIYDYFNKEVFENSLPQCLIVITNKQNVAGHYSYKRWKSLNENQTHELALNPNYFMQRPLMEILQTMVHEMVHCWQFEFGKPGKNGYHNKEWAKKMIEIGLTPSANGQEGGKQIGFKMADYVFEGGLFEEKAKVLLEEKIFKNLWYKGSGNHTVLTQEDLAALLKMEEKKKKKVKIKYSCDCGNNVWGKEEMIIICGTCNSEFKSQ